MRDGWKMSPVLAHSWASKLADIESDPSSAYTAGAAYLGAGPSIGSVKGVGEGFRTVLAKPRSVDQDRLRKFCSLLDDSGYARWTDVAAGTSTRIKAEGTSRVAQVSTVPTIKEEPED